MVWKAIISKKFKFKELKKLKSGDTLNIGEQRLSKYDDYSIDIEGTIVFE